MHEPGVTKVHGDGAPRAASGPGASQRCGSDTLVIQRPNLDTTQHVADRS